MSEGEVPAAEAVRNRKEQQSEPVGKEFISTAEKIKMASVGKEAEPHTLTSLLFDLLDEEDEAEGVELGEEEMGEDEM